MLIGFILLVGTDSQFSFSECVECQELFTIKSTRRSFQPCCDKDSLFCYDAVINPEPDFGFYLLSDNEISFGGLLLSFSHTIAPHGRVYKNEKGDEALMSISKDKGISATWKTKDGRSFSLESCGINHIFEEFDLMSFPAEQQDWEKYIQKYGTTNNVNSISSNIVPDQDNGEIAWISDPSCFTTLQSLQL